MVLLVRDTVIHPGEAGAAFPVEPRDELQDVQLAGLPELPFALGVGALQHLHEGPLAAARRLHAAGVFLHELRKRLAPEVAVGPRQLARHHHAGLRDVHGDLAGRAALGVRLEPQVGFRQVFDLGDDARARVTPGFEGFFEQRGKRHAERLLRRRGDANIGRRGRRNKPG